MTENSIAVDCCEQSDLVNTCCRVVALVSVDERGQMVLPKELRDQANIRAGDKLAIASLEKDGKVCCLSLIRAEEFTGMVREILEPVIKEIL